MIADSPLEVKGAWRPEDPEPPIQVHDWGVS